MDSVGRMKTTGGGEEVDRGYSARSIPPPSRTTGEGYLTSRFCASLKHKYDGQTKFVKPNSQRQDRIIKYWVSIGSIHREQG